MARRSWRSKRATNFRKECRSRIWEGVAFLNLIDETWLSRVNPHKLDMKQRDKDILGQIVGDYYDALKKYDIFTKDAIRLGFDLGSRNDRKWRILQDEWVHVIKMLIETDQWKDNPLTISSPKEQMLALEIENKRLKEELDTKNLIDSLEKDVKGKKYA